MENMVRAENWVWSCSTEGDLEMTHGSSRSADQNPEYLNQLCCSRAELRNIRYVSWLLSNKR